jgi:hypothetical protein
MAAGGSNRWTYVTENLATKKEDGIGCWSFSKLSACASNHCMHAIFVTIVL